MSSRRIIIYTDLDGTLLDHHTYSFSESLPAVMAATSIGIPVVFCSSKTRAEIEHLRQAMNVTAPFIIENGAAIVIPAGYLSLNNWEETTGSAPTSSIEMSDELPTSLDSSSRPQPDPTFAIGMPYPLLVDRLHELQAAFSGQIIGFSDMTEEEVARDCGLTLEEARRAKQREFDEPFKLVNADVVAIRRITDSIKHLGLFCSQGGRYYHLHGNNDKGGAVRILNRLLLQEHTQIFTVGLGDSLNDLPMLESVNYPVLVKKPDGSHDHSVIKNLPGVHLSEGIGPRGWHQTVMGILDNDITGG